MTSDADKTTVTRLLDAVNSGDRHAYDRLLALVYDELRKMAGGYMRRERQGHTLQPTVLVNEVYGQLMDVSDWENRAHFFGAAAKSMRRILVDHARSRARAKRGGDLRRTLFDDSLAIGEYDDEDLLSLDQALEKLRATNERAADTVELRFFAGLNVEEIAGILGIGTATVKRDWRYARAWLLEELDSGGSE